MPPKETGSNKLVWPSALPFGKYIPSGSKEGIFQRTKIKWQHTVFTKLRIYEVLSSQYFQES